MGGTFGDTLPRSDLINDQKTQILPEIQEAVSDMDSFMWGLPPPPLPDTPPSWEMRQPRADG